jgi:DNA polymerase III delta prime subunit
LLVHGEPGLGQHALLLDLAQILSCESTEAKPCGKCFPCRAFEAASLESIQYLIPLVKKEKASEREKDSETSDESLGSAQIEELAGRIRLWHDQPYGFGATEKAMVRVPQTRELLSRLGYARDRGRSRVVLVPYLEALNPEASNALLKTLEEPSADVYFLIASENRAALLPTLLSRCLHLGLPPLPSAELREIASALSERAGKPLSLRLLPFAEGSPGVYLHLLENGGEEMLEEAARFFSAATASDWRVFADYAAEDLESSGQLLHFLLRCVRVHQTLKAGHSGWAQGRKDDYSWTAKALLAEGWDASLSSYLGPLEEVPDLPSFTAYLQSAYQAIKDYSRPQIALLGLFLEYDAKVKKI